MDRAQIHTLEAFIAALLLVGALLFASQATAVTPLSASTSNQHIENQQQNMAEDVLAIAADDGSLQEALTHWTLAEDQHEDVPPHYVGVAEPNMSVYSSVTGTDHPLNQTLYQAFQEGIYAYNIDLRYQNEQGEFQETPLISMGTPSDNAVTATRTVTIFNDDEVYIDGAGETIKLADLEDHEFWLSPAEANGPVYNVVEVRMTIWRM